MKQAMKAFMRRFCRWLFIIGVGSIPVFLLKMRDPDFERLRWGIAYAGAIFFCSVILGVSAIPGAIRAAKST